MAITSLGYNDDSIGASDWANIISRLGSARFGVADVDAWRVTPGPGDREVRITPGAGWGSGVWDQSNAFETVSLAAVPSGERWDLVCMARNWAGKLSAFGKRQGTAERVLPPPPTRKVAPGVEEDQPLALVRARAGSSSILTSDIIDLRVVPGDGGMVAFHELALTYLTGIGTVVRIGSTEYARVLNGDAAVWAKTDTTQVTAPYTSAQTFWQFEGWPPYAASTVTREGSRVYSRGLMSNSQVVSVDVGGHYLIAQIPPHLAPAQQASFPTFAGAGTGPATLIFMPNGNVYLDTHFKGTGFSKGYFILWLDGQNWPAKTAA